MRESQMPVAFSLYLDLLRFVAALMVFVGHLAKPPISRAQWGSGDPVLPVIHDYGAIAVTVFFVLSGYVIAYVVATRERDGRAYAISRISRLYSVVVPALLVTWLFDAIGSTIDPAFYAEPTIFKKPPSIEGHLAGLGFVNEFQIFDFGGIVPGSNAPYWSLSFEAAYYLIAGLILFAPRYIGVLAALIVLVAGGRTIAALLPVWGLGFWLFHARDRLDRWVPLPWLFWIGSLAAMAAIPWLLPKTPDMNFGLHFPWARGELNRNLAADYAAAVAVAVHLVAAKKLLAGRAAPRGALEPTLRWLGAQTFPLYVVHFPAIALFGALSPWPATSPANLLFVAGSALVVVAAITPACEALKRVLRDAMLGRKRIAPTAPTG